MRTIRECAMDYLAEREHSRKELQRKLKFKSFGDNEIELALDKLAKENLQSDTRFTELFVQNRARRGYGPRHVVMELEQRGIDRELIDTYVWHREGLWQETLQQAYRKKYGETRALVAKEKAKRMRFLLQRGFLPEQIREIV